MDLIVDAASQKKRAKYKEDYLYMVCPTAIKLGSLSKPTTDADGNDANLYIISIYMYYIRRAVDSIPIP